MVILNKNVPRYVSGDYSTTPWFPKSWPVKDSTRIVMYFYGRSYTMPLSIQDGARLIAPWAELEYATGAHKVTTNHLEDCGIQGFRPLKKEEKEILNAPPEPDQFTRANKEKLKHFYCLWIKLNGVIYKKIEKKHRELFSWLQCD